MTIAALLIITSLVTNPNFQWDVVGQYLFDPTILAGVWVTVWITFACMGIAVVLGLILAFMGMSKSRFVTGAAEVYIAFFRGTPLLVQLIFWYNIAALYRTSRSEFRSGPSSPSSTSTRSSSRSPPRSSASHSTKLRTWQRSCAED
ncbi:ABC transporter permease subunit [Streptomyces sp. KS_5]|uniref:ABC transporter permease subunit n=1 Tax=Streptomyces sp. KS_5 TaxID=1881018 RepID=UPI00210E7E15|nr:ABC transporter permease subunit [Streptomyces sp. KS_5]